MFLEDYNEQPSRPHTIHAGAPPLIAGPATITAAISLPLEYGFWLTATALTIGVIVNMLIMMSSRVIRRFMMQYNIMGAIIRITGLIVCTMAAQIFLSGLATWYHLMSAPAP